LAKRTKNRIVGLDLLRGFAILLVILHHAWPDVLGSGGIVGVVAFFALSGYLITGILARDIDNHGRIAYGHFYRNRALRLLPALFLMLVFFSIYTFVANPFGDRDEIAPSLLIAVSYTANIPFDYGSPAISHLWTLATEEQFYLVWPLILTLGLRLRRLRHLVLLAAAGIVIVCVASIIVSAPNVARVYSLPSSWAVAMVIGAGAKLGEGRIDALVAATRLSFRGLGVLAFVVLIVLSFVPEAKGSPATYLVGGPCVALLTMAVVFYMRAWVRVPSRLLWPLLALGTVSYSAYLWNWPITLWLGQYTDGLTRSVLSIMLTVVASTISWWAVEKPVARWKDRMDLRAHDAPGGVPTGTSA